MGIAQSPRYCHEAGGTLIDMTATTEKVRGIVTEGVHRALEQAVTETRPADRPEAANVPPWFGSLRSYAQSAAGGHDLTSMRRGGARHREKQPE